MTKPHSKSPTYILYLQHDVSSHLVNICTYKNSSKMFLLFCTLCPIEIGRFVHFHFVHADSSLDGCTGISSAKKASRKKTDLKLCIILFPMSHPQRAREVDPKYLKGYYNHNWQWIEYFFLSFSVYPSQSTQTKKMSTRKGKSWRIFIRLSFLESPMAACFMLRIWKEIK